MNLVYKYGITSPHEGADLVHAQLLAAHRYRNTLIEIERGRRAALRLAERKYGADLALFATKLAEASSHTSEVVAKARAHRSRTRARAIPVELTEELRIARGAEKSARHAWSETRRRVSADPVMSAWRDVINERALALVSGARELSGCYWGTYLLVEEAARKSFAELPLYSGYGEETDPHFLSFDGSGRIGVQLQKGLLATDAYGGDSRLQITLPSEGWWAARRCDRRRLSRQGRLAMRVGSRGNKPIWAYWRLDMHRPLPEGAVITWAVVHRTRCGPHDAWHLTLTVRVPDTTPKSAVLGGAVGINLGWRALTPDTMRVAGWANECGETGELRLDAALRQLRLPKEIQAERDIALNVARTKLLAARDTEPWLKEKSQYAHTWKSPKHFASLLRDWDATLPGERVAWDRDLETFVTNDRHAWAQQEHLRQRGMRRRREIYRIFAARMANAYDTIVVELPGGRERIARRVEPGTSRDEKEQELAAQQVIVARANRVTACTSELANCLKNAAMMRGRRYVEMNATDITRTCPSCGWVDDRNQAEHVQLECECGYKWDQDYEGAGRELLARWREQKGTKKTSESARNGKKPNKNTIEGESLYDRRRRLRAVKVKRLEAARILLGKDAE